MKRYGRRPSHADELRKKNALKFYEPHLSAETRRQLEGHKGPKIEQAEQAVTRVADEMPEFTPEEAARDLGVKLNGPEPESAAESYRMVRAWDLAKESSETTRMVIAQRTHEAEDFSKWPNLKWRQLEQITPNDGNTVLLWWPPHGPCLGTYFTSYLKPWRVVSWDGKTFKASFVELCADGAVFQPGTIIRPSIDPTS